MSCLGYKHPREAFKRLGGEQPTCDGGSEVDYDGDGT